MVLPSFKLIRLGALARHTYRHVQRCSYSHHYPLSYNSWACLVPLNSFIHIISSLQFILLPSFSTEKKMQVSLDCWETFELSLKNEDYFRLPSTSQLKKLCANTGYATTAKDLCTHNTVYVLCSPPYLFPFPISKNCISVSMKQVSQRKEHLQKSYTLKRRYLTQ